MTRTPSTTSILVLAEVFPPKNGGSGRWLWERYRRLPAEHVHVVAGDVDGARQFDRVSSLSIERLKLQFADWGVTRPSVAWKYITALLQLYRVVRRHRPRSIHCGKSLPEGLLAAILARFTGVPFRCYVHGEELTLARTSTELRWLTGAVLRAAGGIIANSHHSERMLLEDWHVPKEKIVVLHPGVDTNRFCPAPRDAAVRRRLGWDDRLVILTVGAMQKRKGQDMLIRALPEIVERCPTVLYSLIGEPRERDSLQSLANDLGVGHAVQFRGAADERELVECYQQCDLFALPNRRVGWDFEGFGIALIEAQACGKPVIAGLSGGTAETLDPLRTGELVDCEHPENLARVVVDLLKDPARRTAMSARARQWAVARFDWDTLADNSVYHFDMDRA
jgi:phosphatidyl-myo-inositol dimannoside synthase